MSHSLLHTEKRRQRAKNKAKENNMQRPKRKPYTQRSTYHLYQPEGQ